MSLPFEVLFTLEATKAFSRLPLVARQEIDERCREVAAAACERPSSEVALRAEALITGVVRYAVDPRSRSITVRSIEQGEPPRRCLRVLIVEDDPDLRWSLVDQLEGAGIKAETANDGLEALTKLHRGFAADAILLDLVMPVMSGSEFLKCRDAEPKLRAIPAVVLTANAHLAVGLLGVEWVLRKPLDVRQLQAVVRQIASQRASAQA